MIGSVSTRISGLQVSATTASRLIWPRSTVLPLSLSFGPSKTTQVERAPGGRRVTPRVTRPIRRFNFAFALESLFLRSPFSRIDSCDFDPQHRRSLARRNE